MLLIIIFALICLASLFLASLPRRVSSVDVRPLNSGRLLAAAADGSYADPSLPGCVCLCAWEGATFSSVSSAGNAVEKACVTP